MHAFLRTLFLSVGLWGITAGGAHACGCNNGQNNAVSVENNATNNNVNAASNNNVAANANKDINVANNNNTNENNNINGNANINYNDSAAQATSSASAQSAAGAVSGATGGNAAGQGGNASTSTSVNVGGDRNPASSAAPVYLTTSNDTCMGSSGVGGQGITFGFSIGSTWTDKNCVMLKNAREMKSQGYGKAAKIRLCMDEDNAIAFEAAGDPCPRALKTAQNAAARMKNDRMAALAPAPDKSAANDAGRVAAAAPAAPAAFMLDSGNKVYFDLDKSDLKPKAQKTLDKQAAWLAEHDKVRVLVAGHCDERGTREYNLALGERRADAVKQYLVAKGIAAERIDTVSYGKDRPAVAESNEAAWAQNRRAVTQILPPKTEREGEKVSRRSGQPGGVQLAALGYSDRGSSEHGYFQSALAAVEDGAE